ncbi:MAG: putative molybdenum carrier protein [Verrucomicrobia bacterium]|nr:putative molybdenum carrier protein [Verrucomicrobiota bacterium]
MLRKVISGGQAGADRAGLDFALEIGLEHGGYAPKGRKAEDGRIDDRYQLVELPSASYPTRTKRNVRASDGTAIFSLRADLTGGSALTLAYARNVKKPVIHLHASDEGRADPAAQLKDFITANRVGVLNVAGSRASKEPGVYEFTLGVLRRYWREHQRRNA